MEDGLLPTEMPLDHPRSLPQIAVGQVAVQVHRHHRRGVPLVDTPAAELLSAAGQRLGVPLP
jgi:hypothetical protein